MALSPMRLRRFRHPPMRWLATPLLLVLQACANSATPAPPPSSATQAQQIAPLWGTQWHLVALGTQPVMAQSKATLQFPEVGRVSGNGSCNQFSGVVTVRQASISIGSLASTKMACMGGAMEQEAAYLAALQKAQRFERQGETLLIHVQGMDQPLRLQLVK